MNFYYKSIVNIFLSLVLKKINNNLKNLGELN